MSAPLLATSVASAQYAQGYPPPGYAAPVAYDGPRFRGGVGLNVGGFFITGDGGVKDGLIGANGQLGVQINHNWGVYAVPELDILFGGQTGVIFSGAVMGDYTFDGIPLSVGLGLESGVFGAIGTSSGTVNGTTTVEPTSASGGIYYGARLHAAFYPVLVRSEFNPARRKGLFIGLDLHIDGNSFGGSVNETGCGTTVVVAADCGASSGGIIVSPVLSVGYQSF